MEIAFCHIDDRLIHGQVATVWSKITGCNRIMCVSDEVAKDELRKKILLQVVPPGLKGYVIPVYKAVEAYKNPKCDSFKTLFLFTNPKDVLRAVKGGIPFKSVNLGGKCFKDGDTLITQAATVNSEVITRGLQVAGGFIVVVGYATVINLMNAQKLMVYFFLGFLIAVFTDVNFIGFGAIGAICAYFHIQGLKKDFAVEEAAKTGGGSAIEGDDIDDSDLM